MLGEVCHGGGGTRVPVSLLLVVLNLLRELGALGNDADGILEVDQRGAFLLRYINSVSGTEQK